MPTTSPRRFYPPRAPWYRPARDAMDGVIRRVRRLATRAGMERTSGDRLLGTLLPGYGLGLLLGARMGTLLAGVGAFLALALIANIGTDLEDPLLATLLGLHATGLFQVHRHRLEGLGPVLRIGASALAALALGTFVYLPGLALFERTCAMPVTTRDGTRLIQPGVDAARLHPGDWVAFQLSPGKHPARFMIRSGLDLAPVQGMPGDTLEFSPGVLRLNGTASNAQSGMPSAGTWTVPPGHWFIWPRALIHRTRTGEEDAEEVDAGLVAVALVSQDRLVGRPYRRWFHRTFPQP